MMNKGWGWPDSAKKAHYFVNKKSLCSRWLYFGDLEDDNHDSPDNCVTCKEKLEKQQKNNKEKTS